MMTPSTYYPSYPVTSTHVICSSPNVQTMESLPAQYARTFAVYEHMAKSFVKDSECLQERFSPLIQQIHARKARLQAALKRTEPFGDQSRTKAWLEAERERAGGLLHATEGDFELKALDARVQAKQQAAIRAQVDAEVDAMAVGQVQQQQRAVASTYEDLVETNPDELMLTDPIPSYDRVQRRYAGYARYSARYGSATPAETPAPERASSQVQPQPGEERRGPVRDGARPSYNLQAEQPKA